MIINIDAQLEQVIENITQLALQNQEPQWALDMRKASLISARTLAAPSKQEEAWRRTSPDWFFPERTKALRLSGEKLIVDEFQLTSEAAASLHEYGINSAADAIDEAQEQALAHKQADSLDQDGVCILSMNQALQQEESLKNSFFKAEHHQKDLSSALNGALRTGGAYVKITPQAKAERAFHILHEIGGAATQEESQTEAQNCHFNHSVICANGPGQAVVVESFKNGDAEPIKVHSLIEFDLANGAQLNYVLIGDWNKNTACLTTIHARLGKDASLKIIYAGIGTGLSKTFFAEDLNTAGAKTEIYGVVLADGKSRSDVDTFVHHKAPHTYSNVLFNCAVSGKARSIFTGNIYVDQVAQQTDAYQKNQNLMLSPQARAESMPKLEIIADDVRCTHGASFTDYNQEQLFYMQSRGLSEAEAKSLLTAGFFQEIVEKADNSTVTNWLATLAKGKFATAKQA
ncbi:MAG: Fe-S cluster assembly protein SufD [Candidatus Bruticola sp.]